MCCSAPALWLVGGCDQKRRLPPPSPFEVLKLLRGIEWVILAQYRGSAFFGPILLFDRYHPSAPTCTRDTPTRAAAVKDGPPSGHHRREASLTATSTTA